jgi:hypothetical protein
MKPPSVPPVARPNDPHLGTADSGMQAYRSRPRSWAVAASFVQFWIEGVAQPTAATATPLMTTRIFRFIGTRVR